MRSTLLIRVLKLCSFPGGAMLGGFLVASLCGVRQKSGQAITSGMQHIGAGVVFCAIAVETVPFLLVSGTLYDTLAIFLGAVVGIGITFGLGELLDLGDSEEDESYFENSPANRKSQYDYGTIDDHSSYRQWHGVTEISRGRKARSVPWGLMAAVAVDALMDGLLIGISTVTGWRSDDTFSNEKAGMMMTLALTIQLCFLGIYSAGTIRRMRGVSICVLPIYALLPLCVMIGGVGGAMILSSLTGAWYLFVISFGTTALLYLVTEELLIETQSQAQTRDQEPETWIVTLQFISGFLCLLICKQVFAPLQSTLPVERFWGT